MAQKSVLVVDDDPLRLSLTIGMIEVLDRVGIGVSNGDRARRFITERPQDIDIVLTDVRMPGSFNGYSLARWISANWPDIRVYITSGYDHDPAEQIPEGAIFLPKLWLSLDVIRFVLEGGTG